MDEELGSEQSLPAKDACPLFPLPEEKRLTSSHRPTLKLPLATDEAEEPKTAPRLPTVKAPPKPAPSIARLDELPLPPALRRKLILSRKKNAIKEEASEDIARLVLTMVEPVERIVRADLAEVRRRMENRGFHRSTPNELASELSQVQEKIA